MSTALTGVWSDGSATSSAGVVPLAAGSSTLVFELGSEKEIGAGSSKIFVLKGTVSDAQDAGDSVTIGLYGTNDTALLTGGLSYHATQLVQINNGTAYAVDFLWSDKAEGVNHTDSYQTTYVDWTNGYLLNVPTDTRSYAWPS